MYKDSKIIKLWNIKQTNDQIKRLLRRVNMTISWRKISYTVATHFGHFFGLSDYKNVRQQPGPMGLFINLPRIQAVGSRNSQHFEPNSYVGIKIIYIAIAYWC